MSATYTPLKTQPYNAPHQLFMESVLESGNNHRKKQEPLWVPSTFDEETTRCWLRSEYMCMALLGGYRAGDSVGCAVFLGFWVASAHILATSCLSLIQLNYQGFWNKLRLSWAAWRIFPISLFQGIHASRL